MDRGGNVIIPAFAVGRTQTLLYYLYKLWKSGRIDDVPVILETARDETFDKVNGLRTGADDYIAKPFSKEQIKEKLVKIFIK